MENVIILILFTYPGVFAEYIYHRLAADKSFYKKPDEVFRVARDFFISAFLTLCALSLFNLFLFREKGLTLASLATDLSKGYLIWIYCGISLALSCIAGLIWYGIALWNFKRKNKKSRKKDGTEHSMRLTAWEDFLHTEGVPYEDCILAIYRNGQLIRAGIAKHITEEIADDPGVNLMYCSTVEGELKRPPEKRALVGYALINYIDLKTGTEVALFDGHAMTDYIRKH